MRTLSWRNVLGVLALRGVAVLLGAAVIGACGGGGGSDSGGGPPDTTIASIVILDGNNQTGTVGTELSRALTVRVLNAAGAPIAGATVNFVVVSGGGNLFAGSSTSDSTGQARERWTVGVTASQVQRVEARAVGAGGVALAAAFNAVAVPGPAVRLVLASGGLQSALQAQALPAPVVIAVRDMHSNPVPGVPVSVSVNNGGNAVPSSASSDASGEVRVAWTLGIPIGPQMLTATAQDLPTLEVYAAANQAPPGAPARIIVSTGDMQTVLQHSQLPEGLEVWVTDALGNGIPGVTVTYAPVAGGPYFRSGTARTNGGVGRVSGYASWRGYFHTAGAQLVEASVAPDMKVTFMVDVTPSAHRFDGFYDCDSAPLQTPTAILALGMSVANGRVSGSEYNDPGHSFMETTFSEDTGSFTGLLRVSLDYRLRWTGTFVVDASGRGTASGTYLTTDFNGNPISGPPGDSGTGSWTCERD